MVGQFSKINKEKIKIERFIRKCLVQVYLSVCVVLFLVKINLSIIWATCDHRCNLWYGLVEQL